MAEGDQVYLESRGARRHRLRADYEGRHGHWHALNFTYYGLLTANALVFGVTILIILFGALRVLMSVTLTLIFAVLLVCLPVAKLVARLVEGKQRTFTLAGAFFVGIFTAPGVILALNALPPKAGFAPVPMTPALAAIMIAYVSAMASRYGKRIRLCDGSSIIGT